MRGHMLRGHKSVGQRVIMRGHMLMGHNSVGQRSHS